MTAADTPARGPMTGRAKADAIVRALQAAGIDLIATLPDAWMTDLLTALAAAPGMQLVRVTREDEAVGICAGAWLGGRRAAVLTQNAGVLLATNTLAGLAHHHQIPVLLLVAQRGGFDDDQYYQVYKGRVTAPVLDAIGVPYESVRGPADYELIADAQRQAQLARRPVALLFTRAALLGDPGAEGSP
jgi:sulfopyruvate decarboxylase subunit alpha